MDACSKPLLERQVCELHKKLQQLNLPLKIDRSWLKKYCTLTEYAVKSQINWLEIITLKSVTAARIEKVMNSYHLNLHLCQRIWVELPTFPLFHQRLFCSNFRAASCLGSSDKWGHINLLLSCIQIYPKVCLSIQGGSLLLHTVQLVLLMVCDWCQSCTHWNFCTIFLPGSPYICSHDLVSSPSCTHPLQPSLSHSHQDQRTW